MSVVDLTDRDLGHQFPLILRTAGLTVERHTDHFAPDCTDDTWLEAAGRHGWVAITHDKRIRYKPNELAAVVRHNVALLVVIGKDPFPELAESFVQTVSRVEAFLATAPRPVIAKIYRAAPAERKRNPRVAGSIQQWYPPPS